VILEVDDIKLRLFFHGLFIFLLLTLLVQININCIAADPEGIHFIGEPTYRLVNTIKKNDGIVGKTYEINVTLKNGGITKTDFFIINLSYGSESLQQKTKLIPDETKIISFTWSTVDIRNQRIVISFYPEDIEATKNKYNTGSTSLTIMMNDVDGIPATSTPGFEIGFLLILVILILFYRKSKLN
jgi:hypothetical protein